MSCNKNKSWKWYFLSSCLLFLITSCGGGGGSSSAPPAENAPVVQGKFIDAPVEGLEYYLSGNSVPKLTLADGTFEYVDGQKIRFQVGGVILGECLAKKMITPVDLVRTIPGHNGATINDPLVTNIVQFLLGVGTLNGPSLIIPAETRVAFRDKQFDLREGTSAANIVNNVPGASVPTELLAQEHFTASLNTIYSGNYRGTISGVSDTGLISDPFFLNIDNAFNITGTYTAFSLSGRLSPETGLFELVVAAGDIPLLGCRGGIDGITGKIIDAACSDAATTFSLSGGKE